MCSIIFLRDFRFNPCSVGFSFRTVTYTVQPEFAPRESFNPCSVGFSFRTCFFCLEVKLYLYVSILVLLDFLFGRSSLPGKTAINHEKCFNPCSVGFSFRTVEAVLTSVSACKKFQSLFCWIFFFGPSPTTTQSAYFEASTGFQSLFCWIFFSDVATV